MLGLIGDFYGIDYSDLMNQELEEARKKYDLSVVQKEGMTHTGAYSNGKCTIRFWVSDRRSIKWEFFQPNSDFKYNLSLYLEFIKIIEKPRLTFSRSIENMEGLIQAFFANFNRELLDYMEVPMSGDFSWHGEYIENLKTMTKYDEFASTANSTHSQERRTVSRMFRRKEKGWKEAIESYFAKHYPDGGKEFEVDDLSRWNQI